MPDGLALVYIFLCYFFLENFKEKEAVAKQCLLFLQEWDTEPDVTLDSWVGHVIEVNEEVTLKFPDGAK